VQRGGGFGNVLAHNGHVADLAVTLPKIEVSQPDRAGIVRNLGLLQRAVVQGNRPGLLASGKGDPAVQAPEVGVQDLGQVFANRVGGASQHRSGLCKIPLQEVRFSQHDANRQLVVSRQRGWGAQQRGQQIDGRGRMTALKGGIGASDDRLQCGVTHGG
jgi:hypothetical protein